MATSKAPQGVIEWGELRRITRAALERSAAEQWRVRGSEAFPARGEALLMGISVVPEAAPLLLDVLDSIAGNTLLDRAASFSDRAEALDREMRTPENRARHDTWTEIRKNLNTLQNVAAGQERYLLYPLSAVPVKPKDVVVAAVAEAYPALKDSGDLTLAAVLGVPEPKKRHTATGRQLAAKEHRDAIDAKWSTLIHASGGQMLTGTTPTFRPPESAVREGAPEIAQAAAHLRDVARLQLAVDDVIQQAFRQLSAQPPGAIFPGQERPLLSLQLFGQGEGTRPAYAVVVDQMVTDAAAFGEQPDAAITTAVMAAAAAMHVDGPGPKSATTEVELRTPVAPSPEHPEGGMQIEKRPGVRLMYPVLDGVTPDDVVRGVRVCLSVGRQAVQHALTALDGKPGKAGVAL